MLPKSKFISINVKGNTGRNVYVAKCGIVRLVVAILFVVANVTGWVTGIVGLVLAVIAGMLLSSVVSGHCPLYVELGIKKTI